MRKNVKTLDTIIEILKQNEYKVIFGRGHFQSGYCFLEEKKMIVVNKFLDIPARIDVLMDILFDVEINTDVIDDDLKEFYFKDISSLYHQKKRKQISLP